MLFRILPCILLLQLLLIEADMIDKKLKELKLDEKGLQNVKNLHYNWYMFSIKALLAQLGKRLRKQISHGNCLKNIKSINEIEQSAKCLYEARYRQNLEQSLISLNRRRIPFRLDSKIKTEMIDRRFKRSPYRLINPKTYTVRQLAKMPSLKDSYPKPVKTLTNLFLTIFAKSNNTVTAKKWMDSYKKMLKLQKAMDRPRSKQSLDIYNHRMYDIVMEPPPEQDDGFKKSKPLDVNVIMNMVNALSKKGHASNIRFLSPRLLPIVADDRRRENYFSPSLFPLYKDDSEDQILPIPEVLEKTGMDKSDRETVLQMIMELSGARRIVENAMTVIKHMNSFGMTDSLIEVTENIQKSFKKMRKSLNLDQKKDLKDDGFSMLEPNQIYEMHHKYGLEKYDTGFNITEYKRLTPTERIQSLWAKVEELANGKNIFKRVRRQATSPTAPGSTRNTFEPVSVLSPTILQPYVFAPTYGLSILGPVILSPNVFSPLLLNPSILSPWIFSPAVPLPFILSPYVLSPYIFSPLVMAPFILTPYVLSPNVFNPYVLSPVILSPLVLCPDVFSPMTLGGPILSPGVLSPSVFSKSILMANVLSPTVLSK